MEEYINAIETYDYSNEDTEDNIKDDGYYYGYNGLSYLDTMKVNNVDNNLDKFHEAPWQVMIQG